MNRDKLTQEQTELFFGIDAAIRAGIMCCVHSTRKSDGKDVALLCISVDVGGNSERVRLFPVALLLDPDSADDYNQPEDDPEMPLRA